MTRDGGSSRRNRVSDAGFLVEAACQLVGLVLQGLLELLASLG